MNSHDKLSFNITNIITTFSKFDNNPMNPVPKTPINNVSVGKTEHKYYVLHKPIQS